MSLTWKKATEGYRPEHCAECGGVIMQLPDPLTQEPTWYHSNIQIEHEARPGGQDQSAESQSKGHDYYNTSWPQDHQVRDHLVRSHFHEDQDLDEYSEEHMHRMHEEDHVQNAGTEMDYDHRHTSQPDESVGPDYNQPNPF